MTTESDNRGWLNQAVGAFQQALNTGLKVQQGMIDCWRDMLADAAASGRRQSTAAGGVSAQAVRDAAPQAERPDLSETVRLLNENARASLDLLDKAFAAARNQVPQGVQQQMRDLWEQSLQAVRDSTQSLVDANCRMVDWWNRATDRTAGGVRSEPESVEVGGAGSTGAVRIPVREAAVQPAAQPCDPSGPGRTAQDTVDQAVTALVTAAP